MINADMNTCRCTRRPQIITVYNKQEGKYETFTKETCLDWLETIGMFAAYEMYSDKDVTRLMNFA